MEDINEKVLSDLEIDNEQLDLEDFFFRTWSKFCIFRTWNKENLECLIKLWVYIMKKDIFIEFDEKPNSINPLMFSDFNSKILNSLMFERLVDGKNCKIDIFNN